MRGSHLTLQQSLKHFLCRAFAPKKQKKALQLATQVFAKLSISPEFPPGLLHAGHEPLVIIIRFIQNVRDCLGVPVLIPACSGKSSCGLRSAWSSRSGWMCSSTWSN